MWDPAGRTHLFNYTEVYLSRERSIVPPTRRASFITTSVAAFSLPLTPSVASIHFGGCVHANIMSAVVARWMDVLLHTGPFPRAPPCRFIMRDIQERYMCMFSPMVRGRFPPRSFVPSRSAVTLLVVSVCVCVVRRLFTAKCIHIKKWKKAPNFLAYGRK